MARYTINQMELVGYSTIGGLLDKPFLKQWASNICGEYISMNYREDMTIEEVEELVEEGKTAHTRDSQKAMDKGTKTHALVENYTKNGKDAIGEIDDEVQNCFLAFLEWEKENIIEYLEFEQPVFDLDLCYAGTLDCIAKMKEARKKPTKKCPEGEIIREEGSVYVLDWKTSKNFYDGYSQQVSAYAHAREKLTGTHTVQFKSDDLTFDKDITYPPIKIDGCGVLRLDKETGEPKFKDYTKEMDRKYKSFCHLLDFFYEDKKRQLKNNQRVK